MLRRAVFSIAGIALCFSLVSCAALKDAKETVTDLFKIRSAVSKFVNHPDVTVNLNNGSFLVINVVNSPWNSKPANEKSIEALKIAHLAYKNSSSLAGLKSIRVMFGVHKSFLGVFNYDSFTDFHDYALPLPALDDE